ncbi:DUF6493 family protein [Streptomyces sp. NPDC057301]|uniref:DUF7824 domain-containing protein n=1 Tax=Streptomyces sp. NPDC057301 TaxID=3346093 RepID=UPI00363FD6D2
MKDFRRWLAQFADAETEIGELARWIAADPNWPEEGLIGMTVTRYYYKRLRRELRSVFNEARRQHHDAEATDRLLAAAREGGSVEQVVALYRNGPGEETDRALMAALDHRDPAWVEEFTHAAARGEHGYPYYRLVLRLVHRHGIEVAPTADLAVACLEHHIGRITSDGDTAAVIGERLRDDPLAASALPLLPRCRHHRVSYGLGDAQGRYGAKFAAERVLTAAVEQGLINRQSLIDDLVSILRSDDPDRAQYTGGYVSLMEHLAPSDEELAPFLADWVRLSTTVEGMKKELLARAVIALVLEERLPDGLVTEWVRVIGEESTAVARNAVTALTVLAGDTKFLSDQQVADVVRCTTDVPGPKAIAVLACVQSFVDAGRLTGRQIADCAREVLFRPERSVVNSMITFLGRILRSDPGQAVTLVPLLSDAFGHSSADVQEKAFQLAAKYADRLDGNARAGLAEAAEQLVPALRARARESFGGGPGDEPVPPYEESLPTVVDPERLESPASDLAEAVEDMAVLSRARVLDPAQWERVLDEVVRFAHRDRAAFTEAVTPLLKGCNWDPVTDFTYRQLPLLVAAALTVADDPNRPEKGVVDALLALNDDLDGHKYRWRCGVRVFDQVLHVRLSELTRRFLDHDIPPFLLATPTWTDGAIAPGELVERLATYQTLGARPGTADFEQALLRVRHDSTAADAADAALGTPEAGRLARWLRDGGLTPPGTTRCAYAPEDPSLIVGYRSPLPYRLREALADAMGRLDGFSEPFRQLASAYVDQRDDDDRTGSAAIPLWLTVLPAHREIVTARTLNAFTQGAELNVPSAARVLPQLVDTPSPAGASIHLALAYGLGAALPQERVAASDTLLALAARGTLDTARLGHDIADLVTHGTLKVARLAESLTLAAQAGAHLTVGAVLAVTLPPLLPEPGATAPAGLAKLLTLAAECAEETRSLPPVDGIAELAARKGTSLQLKAARRLHTATVPPPA